MDGLIWLVILVGLPLLGSWLYFAPLRNPAVEWEATRRVASGVWDWTVAVGDSRVGDTYCMSSFGACIGARRAANQLLHNTGKVGRTRPCALCGKPSRLGLETDTDECAQVLAKARAELPKAEL